MAKRATRRRAAGNPNSPCPCGSGEPYDRCCGPAHRGNAPPPTAETLMRSRFSAFAVADPEYLLRTWHSTRRPASLQLDPAQRWLRLEILATVRGGLFDTAGTVEFRAHFRRGGQPGSLHEESRFVREDGQWRYLEAAR